MGTISNRARRIGAFLSALWMPPECVHCRNDRWLGLPLCRDCHRSLKPWLAEKPEAYRIRDSRFLFVLSPALSVLIHGFKYHHRRRYAAYLCACARRRPGLAAWAAGFDALVPVPVHRGRRRERGYNQAEVIAGHLGELWGRPVWPRALVRKRSTRSQTRLSKGERGRNLEGAFACPDGSLKGKRILLIDDVFTTGATSEACAAALLRAGAAEVAVFALAKVEPGSPEEDFVRELEAAAAYAA
ncbi:MAG: ComF family protein [Fibrobacteres bacterium]|jgi:ComF family protein|nr:ComF family protein [Fibrobacterota bacterium]